MSLKPSMPDLHIWFAGGEIASTFDHPDQVKLGHCKLIEEIMIGEDRLIHFSGVAKAEACTIVLRGASEFPAMTICKCLYGILTCCMCKPGLDVPVWKRPRSEHSLLGTFCLRLISPSPVG